MSAMNAQEPEPLQETDKVRLATPPARPAAHDLASTNAGGETAQGRLSDSQSVYRRQFDVRVFFDHRDLSRRVCQRGVADSSRQRVRWRRRLYRALDPNHQPIRRRVRFPGRRCRFRRRPGGLGIYLGTGALAKLGLAGGGYSTSSVARRGCRASMSRPKDRRRTISSVCRFPPPRK